MTDFFPLGGVSLYMLDLDRVLRAAHGAAEELRELCETIRELGAAVVFTTNDSSRNNRELADRLNSQGIMCEPHEIITSGSAVIRFIRENRAGARVHLTGTPAMYDEFLRERIELVGENPDLLVLGFDTTVTYRKLCELAGYVKLGIEYIATNSDLNYKDRDGYKPGTGGILAFIKAVAGRDPDIIVGKPFRYMMDMVLADTGLSPSQIAVVGDKISTDMAFARRCGAVSVFIQSDSGAEREIKKSVIKPDFVMRGYNELSLRLKKVLEVGVGG